MEYCFAKYWGVIAENKRYNEQTAEYLSPLSVSRTPSLSLSFYISITFSISVSLYIYISLSLYLYIFFALSLYLSSSLYVYLSRSLSLSLILKNNEPPTSNPYRRRQVVLQDYLPCGTWRCFQAFLGGCKPHKSSWYQWEFCVCFLVSTGEAPMAVGVSAGAIDTGDLLRLGPSGDTSDGRRHDLLCPYPDMRRIVARSRVQ